MTSADVEFQLEQMMPEIVDLEDRGVFTAPELKTIMSKRRDFEYRIHRMQSLKSDFIRYIAYEAGLESLRRLRKKRLGLDSAEVGLTLSDYSIVRRVHNLYQKTLKKFKGDVELWIQYFDWSKKMKSTRTLGKNFAKAIQLHPTKSIFWILAAKWEWEDNGSILAARVLLQRGIRLNPRDTKLWLEYFKLELLWVAKLKERRKILFNQDLSLNVKEQINENEKNEGILLANLAGEEENQDIFATDKILLDSKQEGTQELLVKDLNPQQQALVNLIIPKVVYKSAIKSKSLLILIR